MIVLLLALHIFVTSCSAWFTDIFVTDLLGPSILHQVPQAALFVIFMSLLLSQIVQYLIMSFDVMNACCYVVPYVYTARFRL